MNKLVIAAVVVVAIVLLAIPRVVASITEARVHERVAAIDANGTVAARVTAFERGWFRSTAKIELSLAPDAAQLGNLPPMAMASIPIAVEFAHGPVAMLDGTYFGWSQMVAHLDPEAPGITELTQTLGVPYLFEFRGRTGFAGGLSFDADAPPFELPIDEALLTFSGGTLDGTFDGRQLEARTHVGSLDFTSPTGTFAISNLRASADNELRSQYVMPGEATFSIERIAVSDAFQGTTPVFETTNLSVVSATTLDSTGALLEMRVAYGLDSLRVAETEVSAATLEMVMRNLDVAALEAYSAAISDAAATSDPADVLAVLGPQLDRALRAGPSLTLDPIRFRLDAEPFEGRVELVARPDRLPPAGALDLDNPLLVMGLLDTDAEVRLSKTLAQKLAVLVAQMQLASDGSVPADELEYLAEAQSGLIVTMLVGQGVLLEDGDDYRSSLVFSDGALTLNGNALPFGLP